MQQQKVLDNIIKDCFWDLNFTDKDIKDIINSKDIKRKSFLFNKILLNSTNLFMGANLKTSHFAQSLRQAKILILEILHVFLWLKF